MATFGKTSVGGTAWGGGNYGFATRFQLAEAGSATSIHVYMSVGGYVKLAIYDEDGSNLPNNLLVSTGEVAVSAGWNQITISQSLSAGYYYLFGTGKTNTEKFVYDSGYSSPVDQSQFKNLSYASMPPDPFGEIFSSAAREYSIYVTYTPEAATYTKTWSTDVLLKKLGITETISIDVALQKQDITETAQVNTLFKKFDIKNTADIDVFLKALGIEKTVDVDTLFRKLDLLETFGVDTALVKRNIIMSFGVDVRFGTLVTEEISRQIDVLFKRLDATKNFGLDVYFGPVEAEAYAKNFALDVVFAYKVRLPELWLDENGKMVLNISKPYTWVGT